MKDRHTSPHSMGNRGKRIVSSRAANPITRDDNPHHVFCDRHQAKATTATRLFRNEPMFHALREGVLAPHLDKRFDKTLSLWSAGCSSGEEVYSLLMVAAREFDRRDLSWNISLFGTDINPERLQEARAGRYLSPPGIVPSTYQSLLERYALRDGAYVRMTPEIRACAKFGRFDIRMRPKKHTFDFIVCNHVLQYYDLGQQIDILRNFASVLRLGGFMYIEGITAASIEPAGICAVDGFRNLFCIA